MAKGTTHILFGILVSVIIILVFFGRMTHKFIGMALVCAVAGSLFPDIDTRSKGRTLMYYIMIPAYVFMIYYRQIMMCLLIICVAFLPLLCVHRGLFHRLWFIGLLIAIFSLSLMYIFPHCFYQIFSGTLFFLIGAISHLCLDFWL